MKHYKRQPMSKIKKFVSTPTGIKSLGDSYFPPVTYGMGDVSTDANVLFGQQIADYQNQLYSLYSDKTNQIADRETSRYQYVGQWVNRYLNVINAIGAQVYATGDNVIYNAFLNAMSMITSFVPGMTITGKGLNKVIFGRGFNFNFGSNYVGNTSDSTLISFLTPITFWYSNNSSGTPYYKAYRSTILNNSINVLGDFPGPIGNTWAQVSSYNSLDGKNYPFDENNLVPWFVYYISNAKYYSSPTLTSDQFLSESQKLVSIVNAVYGGDSFKQVMSDWRALYAKLMQQTLNVFNDQYNIDDLEAQVKDYITQYLAANNASGQTVDQVMAQLEDFSQLQNAQNILAAQSTAQANVTAPVGSTVVTNTLSVITDAASTNPMNTDDVQAQSTTVAPAQNQSSSKLPMILAAGAAVGIFIMNKDS